MLPEGYGVRPLRIEDAAGLAAAYSRNREHLAPWEPVRPDSFFTVDGQRTAVAAQLELEASRRGASWVLTRGEEIVGRVNLSNVVLGVFRSGSLGYWVDADHQRRGLATAAVRHAVEGAEALGLHRVEAGTLLHNTASQTVLLRAGFEHFGTARSYLFIAGAWQDHHLYQRILHDRPL